MFNPVSKLSKQLKRAGCVQQKVLFAIYCHEVTFTSNEKKVRDGSMLSVCFERGGKLSSSPDRTFISGATERVFYVNEPLNLVATVYKEIKTGKYQGKVGKVIVRELSKNKFGGSSYVGLGMSTLNLHEYVPTEDETSSQQELKLKLDKLDAMIRITITCQLIASSGGEDIDDTMSVLSGTSDISELGASFETEASSRSSPSGIFGRGMSSTFTRKDSAVVKDATIPEEDDEDGKDPLSPDEFPSTHDQFEDEPHTITWGPSSSVSDNIVQENSASMPTTSSLSNESPDKESTSSPKPPPSQDDDESAMNMIPGTQLLEEKIPLSQLQELRDNRADNESLDLLLRLETYRQEVGERDTTIATLRHELKEHSDDHQRQLFQLRAELTMTKELLKREQLGRSALASANGKADNSISSALAQAREETAHITEEYAHVAAELEAARESLKKSRYEHSMMEEKLEDMVNAARQAATAATLARMKLSERESETEDLIDELIASKMNCANYATDYEEEKRRNNEVRRKLQRYAERVALLEVHIAMHPLSAAKQLQHLELPHQSQNQLPATTSLPAPAGYDAVPEASSSQDTHSTTEL